MKFETLTLSPDQVVERVKRTLFLDRLLGPSDKIFMEWNSKSCCYVVTPYSEEKLPDERYEAEEKSSELLYDPFQPYVNYRFGRTGVWEDDVAWPLKNK